MNHLKTISVLLITVITILSCKKSNDDKPVNWAEELKGSVWAGEFKYNTGAYTGLQPVSIVINNDNTLTWYEVAGSYTATWLVSGNTVTIKFISGSTVSASLSKDTWSNFTNITTHPWQIGVGQQTSLSARMVCREK